MGKDRVRLSRRRLLKLGAAGVAVAGSSNALSQLATKAAGGPIKPVAIRSSALELMLDAESGLPSSYRLVRSGILFRGEEAGVPLRARLCQLSPRSFADVDVKPASHSIAAGHADFRLTASSENGVPAADLTLRYTLEGGTVRVTLEEIKEREGFELISLSMPSLVCVDETDAAAWLAHGDSGGDLVALKDATAAQLPLNTFWGEINGVLPVIMIGHSGAVCVQETTAYMDGTLLSVVGEAPSRRARMGTTKVHRVDGSACYDMNLGKGAPKSCGNATTPNLLVEQQSACRLDFLEPTDASGALSWLDAARRVRARMPEIPNHFYDDKLVYGIRVDEPKFPKPSATFERCEEMIREMHALTDGAPQLVHLWGWQFRGKDTGYPAVNVVNERVGGYDGMMSLMARAKPLNATVSLSDNYDDAYRSSPAWNEEMIARKPDGDLWQSREWTGEVSYIQGLAKYMEGPGPDRVKYTCQRYKLPGTIHVDVLSYYAIRNDWDRKRPASGIRNLVAGRYKVLEDFKAYGVDVTSEGLRYPFIGKMSMSWYAGGPRPCPFGGKPVPMLSMIYRKSAVWGRAGNAGDLPLALMMFYGEAQHSIFNGDAPIERRLDSFYLAMVPWFKLHMLNIEGFERTGDRTVTTLEGRGNRVEIDWTQQSYTVFLDGVEVANRSAVYCPLDRDRIAMYSVADGPLTATIPAEWDVKAVTAWALFTEKKSPVDLKWDGRKVTVAMRARQPVMLYRQRLD